MAREFLGKVLDKKDVSREVLLDFCRRCTPFLKENIKNAAISEINEYLNCRLPYFLTGYIKKLWNTRKR